MGDDQNYNLLGNTHSIISESMVQEEWVHVVAPIIQFMVFLENDINGVNLLIIA